MSNKITYDMLTVLFSSEETVPVDLNLPAGTYRGFDAAMEVPVQWELGS